MDVVLRHWPYLLTHHGGMHDLEKGNYEENARVHIICMKKLLSVQVVELHTYMLR